MAKESTTHTSTTQTTTLITGDDSDYLDFIISVTNGITKIGYSACRGPHKAHNPDYRDNPTGMTESQQVNGKMTEDDARALCVMLIEAGYGPEC